MQLKSAAWVNFTSAPTKYRLPSPEYPGSQGRKTMADDLTNRGPADRSRVNVNEEWERRYWCKEFNCTEQQLRDAVKKVGVMVADVRRHLGK